MPACATALEFRGETSPEHAGNPAQPRKTRWITNDGAEFINSLCPNTQYPFPELDWCTKEERDLLEEACAAAFGMIKTSWDLSIFARIDPKKCTVTEHRILAVIELKTLRFNKLLDKISRKTFFKGDNAEDRYGFEIVPKSGLSDGNLTTALASLKKKRSVGCVKADQHNGNDPSNIYCVVPIKEVLMLFDMYVQDALSQMRDKDRLAATRCTELAKEFGKELGARCRDIVREDEGHANVQ